MEDDKPTLQSPKGAKSPYWQHFGFEVNSEGVKLNESVVKCKLCYRDVGYSRNTSNLKQHIELHHPESMPGTSGCGSVAKQTIIDSFSTNPRPKLKRGGKRDREITEALTRFVAKDMRPSALIEGEGFSELVHTLEPAYEIPSRKHVMSKLREMYAETREKLESKLSEVGSVSITLDFWTSHANESFLGVTVHLISEEWVLCSYVLQTRNVKERHTADNVAECIRHVIVEWQIPDKLCGITTDNARNIVAAARQLPWTRFPCIAHTLQLAVNAGLKVEAVQHLVGRCRKIVGHFNHSHVAQSALETTQSRLDLPQHKLIQDVSTRWNSAFQMMERVMEQQAALSTVLIGSKKISDRSLILTADEITNVEYIVSVLKPFAEATEMLSVGRAPSLSLVQPVLCALRRKALAIYETDATIIQDIKGAISQNVDAHFNNTELNQQLLVVSLLDPRFKYLKFLSRSERLNTHAKLKAIANEISSIPESCAAPPSKRSKGEGGLLDFSDSSDSNGTVLSVTRTSAEKEVDAYIAEDQIEQGDDPLEWWRVNQHRFVTLAKLARKWLCIQATSVPAERLFSSAGEIVSKKRSSLKPANVDILLFLSKNVV